MSDRIALAAQLDQAEAALSAAERGTREHVEAMQAVFDARRELRLAQEAAGVRNGLVAVEEEG